MSLKKEKIIENKRVDLNFKRKMLILLLSVGILLGVWFWQKSILMGASYNWVQTDWSGGLSTLYPRHDTYQTGWTYYWSETSGVVVGPGDLSVDLGTTVPASSTGLIGRKDASTAYDPTSNKFYIFGGYYLDSTTNDPVYLSEIVQYDPSTGTATTTNIGILPIQLFN
jgi:hypothetical protein